MIINVQTDPYECSSPYFTPYRKLQLNAADASCSRLALGWLNDCIKNHDCSAAETVYFTSITRFLHIGGIAEEPTLVSFPSGSCPAKWAALSYCWGTEPSSKLTSKSLPSFEQGIMMATLDATVCDTICVARDLGIKYIWIDALCIIQDDKKDMDLQMAKMRLIYEKSIVTLVTTHTSSVKQGFLSSRNVKYVPVTCGSHNYSNVAPYRHLPEEFYLSESDITEQNILGGPGRIGHGQCRRVFCLTACCSIHPLK